MCILLQLNGVRGSKTVSRMWYEVGAIQQHYALLSSLITQIVIATPNMSQPPPPKPLPALGFSR